MYSYNYLRLIWYNSTLVQHRLYFKTQNNAKAFGGFFTSTAPWFVIRDMGYVCRWYSNAYTNEELIHQIYNCQGSTNYKSSKDVCQK